MASIQEYNEHPPTIKRPPLERCPPLAEILNKHLGTYSRKYSILGCFISITTADVLQTIVSFFFFYQVIIADLKYMIITANSLW